MKGLWIAVLVSFAVLTAWCSHALGASMISTSSKQPPSWPRDHAKKVTFRLDFSDYAGGSIEEWLESKGFKFEEAAKNRNAFSVSVQNGALVLEAKEQLRGFLYNDSISVEEFSKVKIEWGILRYPEGASYEQQVRNEGLMVYISFGQEKMPSGNIILPKLPYFIGFFLCTNDKLNTPYIGKYYQEGGRFVCLAHADLGQTITSEFDLVTAFRSFFDKADVPPISGINLGVDTSDAGNGGRAAAYIKAIEFID
jgi:hypothetical protein